MKKNLFFVILFLIIRQITSAQNPQLWGMTYSGGINNRGTIFKIYGNGTGFYSVYSFDTVSGFNPRSNLIQAHDGKLYGLASNGGANNYGTLFSFDPISNSYNDLFDFNFVNGAYPRGSLMQANNNLLYGMTHDGGIDSGGVIFSFDIATNVFTKLFDFSFNDGIHPFNNLIQASNGKLYGMTSDGGNATHSGVLFSFELTGNIYTKLIDFSTCNGVAPFGSLIEIGNRGLYGMTSGGGSSGFGNIFGYSIANNTCSNFADLGGFLGGMWTFGSLVQANNGKLYGMTQLGGLYFPGGILFSYNYNLPFQAPIDLVDFHDTIGYQPMGSLIKASDGNLYGMTSNGGDNHHGTVFNFDPSTNVYTKLHAFIGTDGSGSFGDLIEIDSTLLTVNNINDNVGSCVNIYPNPANDIFIINVKSKFKNSLVEILNVFGEKIFSEKILNDSKEEIHFNNVLSGVYFVKVFDGENNYCKKLIVEHD